MKRKDINIRDPFVFTENGKYYLLGTTGGVPWGKESDLTLFVSQDLENFERKCYMVTDGSFSSYVDIWAPELHKYNGSYYLIFPLIGKIKGGEVSSIGRIVWKSRLRRLRANTLRRAVGNVWMQRCSYTKTSRIFAFPTSGLRPLQTTATEVFIYVNLSTI